MIHFNFEEMSFKESLNWDAAYDAAQVHTASYCVKVSACQQGESTVNMAGAAAVFMTGGSSLKFLLSTSEDSCL